MGKSTLSKRRGRYGRSKFRAFLVLQQLGRNPNYGRDGWLATRELAVLSGLPYRSLTKLIDKWLRYEYIERRPATITGRGDYEYRLLLHGEAWIKIANEKLYNRNKFHNELKEWVNFVLQGYDTFMAIKFNEVVSVLDSLIEYQKTKSLKDMRITFQSDNPVI
jgi:DNA-binding MarR family transcriptional regulator